VKKTLNDDVFVRDFKKCTPISGPHSIFRAVIGQPFDIAGQVVLQEPQPFYHSLAILRVHSLQVFLGFGFEGDSIFHGVIA